jgi:NAD(P)H dehydrogenase (quinone)
VKTALESARPGKVVCLSPIGAQATQSNLLTQRTLMEQALGVNDSFIARRTDVPQFSAAARQTRADGRDSRCGGVAAQLLQETWSGKRVVENDAGGRSPGGVGLGLLLTFPSNANRARRRPSGERRGNW